MKIRRLLALVLMMILLASDSALANDWFGKTTGKTTIYKKASSSSATVTSVESDQWLYISEIKDGWAKVNYNGKVGYTASHKVKKRCKAVYVKSETAVIYKEANTGSKKLTTIPYGTKLDGYYSTGSFTYVDYGKYAGFVKTSSIALSNPCTMDKTVYLKKESGTVYAMPSSSASTKSVSGTTALKCVGKIGSWYRVTYSSGKVGFVKTGDVSSEKYTKKSSGSSSSSSAKTTTKTKSSGETAANKTMYVKSGYASIYKSASTSANRVATAPYGSKVTVTAVNGDWCKVKYSSSTGYCKKSALTGNNPNTLNNKVYAKSSNVKIYKYPNTSSDYVKASTSTALTQTAKYDSWSRVTYNGKVGFVKTSDLSSTKVSAASTSSPSGGKAKEIDWFKGGIQKEFYKGRIATVTDVKTKISWKVKRKGGSNHADVEPLTAADTAAMKKACGSDFLTWHRRAIWVSLNGNKYAASMNCMAHGLSNIKDNNFDGHFCIHFTNSRTHGSDKVDSAHQSAIKQAAKAS